MNRKAAEHDIAVSRTSQPARFAKCEVKSQFIGNEAKLILLATTTLNAQHFLQGNDVCIYCLQHIRNAVGADATVQSSTLVNIVGYDSKMVGLTHGNSIFQ